MKFNQVTPDIVECLRNILGDKNVIIDEEKMESYSHDETPVEQYKSMPEVVITPINAKQISDVVKLANDFLIPVTPRGAGSGLSGGAIPVHGGILLSVEKMNKVIEIDYENMMIVVEPGLITNEINGMVAEKGLFFAGYPMSLESCYVGGNIAENAGGGKAVKYGVTGQYVMGLEVVTPTGDIVNLGGKLIKDVTGYDLKKLMIGSEGTLGIVTKAIIKLSPLPKFKTNLLVLFEDITAAIATVPVIMSKGGIVPTSIEFMDKLAVHTACEYLNEHLPYQKAGAMLLIEVDGTKQNQVDDDSETIGELCLENGAIEVYVADNYTTQERVWSVRRNIAEAFKVYSPHQSLEDIVVPIGSIAELMPKIEHISEKYDIKMPSYGHAGDGNLHTTLVKNPKFSMDQWYEIEELAVNELYQEVKKLGGKISGEHGIGVKRIKYMSDLLDEGEINMMRLIKNALDPNHIMNPGKVIEI